MADLREMTFELTAPDGRVHRFRCGGVIPVDGTEYVVLLSLDATDGSAVLVTRLVQTDDGLSFEIVEDEETVGQVYMRFASVAKEE